MTEPIIKITKGKGKNRGLQTITITADEVMGAGWRMLQGMERETGSLNSDGYHILAADARVLADALRVALMPSTVNTV